MRVLLVSHAFLPYSRGGVEVCTANVAIGLRQRGHDVRIVHRVAEPDRPEYEVRHGEWESLPVTTVNNTFAHVDSFEMTYRNRVIDKAYSELIKQLEPDVVHFEHLTCLSTGLVEATGDLGIPSVLTLHDYWLVCQRGQMLRADLALCDAPEPATCACCMAPSILARAHDVDPMARASRHWLPVRLDRLRRRIARRYPRAATRGDAQTALSAIHERTRHAHQVMRLADLLLTPSAFHRSQFVRFGVEADRIRVQSNALRTEPFDGYRHQPADHIRFVFLGSVIPSKGVHVLVEAFNSLADTQATLGIHGWAPSYEGFPNYLRDLTAAAGPRITFFGGYDNARIATILAEADAVVIPSVWNESASMIAHEAFLARVPVIAARIGALAEFVEHNVNGLLFEPRDSDDLRRQMQRLLDDPELRASLARNPGPVKTVEQQAIELEDIYRQLATEVGAREAVGIAR